MAVYKEISYDENNFPITIKERADADGNIYRSAKIDSPIFGIEQPPPTLTSLAQPDKVKGWAIATPHITTRSLMSPTGSQVDTSITNGSFLHRAGTRTLFSGS